MDWGEIVKIGGSFLLLAYGSTLAHGLKNILFSFLWRQFVFFLVEGEYFEDQKFSAAKYTNAQRRLYSFYLLLLGNSKAISQSESDPLGSF